ncbi:MAG: T9SS type A sorting domain-containing protein, partial [Chitinophagales bacterium]
LAFSVFYDIPPPATIKDVKFQLQNSWLGDINTNMRAILQHDKDNDRIDIALTRINHQNKIGSGTTIVLEIDVENLATTDSLDVNFEAKNIQMVVSTGQLIPVGSEAQNFTLYAPPCLDDVLVEYVSDSAIPTFTQGSDYITIGDTDGNGTVEIKNGDRNYLRATNSVQIEAGTDIQLGAVFDVGIGDCPTESNKQEDGEIVELRSNLSLQIAPNPFSDQTTIDYYLPTESSVVLTIYNLTGQVVKRLVQNKLQKAGGYQVHFTPCNMESGIYLCHIQTATEQQTLRLLKTE